MQVSPNFAFLKVHDLQLVRLGSQAECYFAEDLNTCLIKLRQFGQLLAQLVAATVGLYEEEAELRQLAEELLVAAEAEAAESKAKLIGIQAQTVAQKSLIVQQLIANAQQNGRYLDLDERETRRLIDAQLRSAGWEADTEEIRYSQGARPVKGRYLAIAEWPTASGNADYALFAGLDIIGVVEAKRQSKNVAGDIVQAKRYSYVDPTIS